MIPILLIKLIVIVLNIDIVFFILATIHKRENKDYLPCIADEKN